MEYDMTIRFTSKHEIVERLRKQIEIKDSTAIHTLMFIFDRQIEDEQRHETVKYRNGIGFKPQDAKRGSSFAKWYKDKGFFTAKQMNYVKQFVSKYAGQVVEAKICEGEIKQLGRGDWIWG
jgi:hypothetical protein